jgi:predicted metallo-beta-lactamase superfamily hydrolase
MSGRQDVITITINGSRYARQEIVDAIYELLFECEIFDEIGFEGTNTTVEFSSTLEQTPEGEKLYDKMICSVCHGEGEVPTSWDKNGPMIECEECSGKGAVEK